MDVCHTATVAVWTIHIANLGMLWLQCIDPVWESAHGTSWVSHPSRPTGRYGMSVLDAQGTLLLFCLSRLAVPSDLNSWLPLGGLLARSLWWNKCLLKSPGCQVIPWLVGLACCVVRSARVTSHFAEGASHPRARVQNRQDAETTPQNKLFCIFATETGGGENIHGAAVF